METIDNKAKEYLRGHDFEIPKGQLSLGGDAILNSHYDEDKITKLMTDFVIELKDNNYIKILK